MLDLAWLVHGSLESCPTPEKQQGVRLVTGIIALLLIAAEFGLWRLARWVVRRRSA
jgi:hypothetical protein